MKFDVNINVYLHSSSLEAKIDKLLHNQEMMMPKIDELLAQLQALNTTTDELANDVGQMLIIIKNAGDGGLTPEQVTQLESGLTALQGRLSGLASAFPVNG